MTAATSSTAGSVGLVPAPASGEQGKFLRGDGTWAKPTDTTYTFDGTYNASTNKAATVSTVTNAIAAIIPPNLKKKSNKSKINNQKEENKE